MSRSISKIVRVSKWFPPGDPLGAKVARLCILREDFLIETQGIYTERIRELDEHSEQFRRIYFLRRLTLTLNELLGAMTRLLCDTQFKALLATQPDDVRAQFSNVGRRIAEGQPITREIRDAICAHVLESAVQAALQRMDPEAFGFFEVAPIAVKTHMKFADEIVAEILLSGVSPEDRANITASKFAKIADMFFLFTLIDKIVLMYGKDGRLL